MAAFGDLTRSFAHRMGLVRMATRHPLHRSQDGFTLVELIVVVAVGGMLLSLVLPAVQMSREASRRTKCIANLKQLAVALQNHEMSCGKLPAGSIKGNSDSSPQTGWGWGARILPYLEEQALYAEINFQSPTGEGRNGSHMIPQVIEAFRCPSDPVPARITDSALALATGNYCGSAGTRGFYTPGVLYEDSDVGFRSVTDGLSKTFFIGERVTQSLQGIGEFTSGWYGKLAANGAFLEASIPHLEVIGVIGINQHLDFPGCFSSYHGTGAHFAMCDGSVLFLEETIDPATYQSLGTRNGNETVDF